MTGTNWYNPERTGVVMWSHKDGRHLFAMGGGYIVAFWRADKQWLVCDDDHELGFCASERVKDLNYLGPVLTPTQISEMLGGERERIAAWVATQRNDVPATGEEFAAAIHNLGAAS